MVAPLAYPVHPPHGANYWKVLWGVDSIPSMKVIAQSAHTPLAWWRPWLIPSPPHGGNYWKVLWGVDSIPCMKVNKSYILGSHNERTMQNKCNCFCLYSLVE